MRFGRKQNGDTPPAEQASTRDALIAKRRGILEIEERDLTARREVVKAAEAEALAKHEAYQVAQRAHFEAAQDYRWKSQSYDRQRADIDREVRALGRPEAIDQFDREMNEEAERVKRLGESLRTVGKVVDGNGRSRIVQHSNRNGWIEVMDQIRHARMAAEELRFTATDAELAGELARLRASIDYALLERFEGPDVRELQQQTPAPSMPGGITIGVRMPDPTSAA